MHMSHALDRIASPAFSSETDLPHIGTVPELSSAIGTPALLAAVPAHPPQACKF